MVDSTCDAGTILGVVNGNQLEDNARKCEPGDAETPATASWNVSRSDVTTTIKDLPSVCNTRCIRRYTMLIFLKCPFGGKIT